MSLSVMKIPTHLAVHTWRPAAWLRVSGADAAGFLQGQFTNDLNNLAGGEAAYGLWLNAKGKVLADSFVGHDAVASEFWVGSYFSESTVIRERLEAYVIADDVVIEDVTKEWTGVSLLGNGANQLLAELRGFGRVFLGRRGRD